MPVRDSHGKILPDKAHEYYLNKKARHPDCIKLQRKRQLELHPNCRKVEHERWKELHPDHKQIQHNRYVKRIESNPNHNRERHQRDLLRDPDINKKAYRKRIARDPDYIKKHYQAVLKNHPNISREKSDKHRRPIRIRLCKILEDGRIKCRGCNVDDIGLLSFDHIEGDGLEDRIRFNNQPEVLWAYYITHPDEAKQKLQALCKNCHWIKSLKNGDLKRRPKPLMNNNKNIENGEQLKLFDDFN